MNPPSFSAPLILHDGDAGALRYAQWLAEEFGGPTAQNPSHFDEVDPAEVVVASTIVLLTGIRPDGTLGGSAFLKENWEALVEAGRRVCVVMVGASPVTDESRIQLMSNEFSEDQLRALKLFQLRGIVDSSQLGLRQRLALKAALAALKRKPDLTPYEQALLDSGGGLDFSDRESLGPLLRWIRREA